MNLDTYGKQVVWGVILIGIYEFTKWAWRKIEKLIEKRRKKKQVSLHIPHARLEGITEPVSMTFTAVVDSNAMGEVLGISNGEEQGMKLKFELNGTTSLTPCPHGNGGAKIYSVSCQYCKEYNGKVDDNHIRCRYKYKHKEQQMEKPTYEERVKSYEEVLDKWEFLPKVSNGGGKAEFYVELWRGQAGYRKMRDDCGYCDIYRPGVSDKCPDCPLHAIGTKAKREHNACIKEYFDWHQNPTRENAQAMLDLIKRTKPVKEVEHCCGRFQHSLNCNYIKKSTYSPTAEWMINDGEDGKSLGGNYVDFCPHCGKKPIPPIGK